MKFLGRVESWFVFRLTNSSLGYSNTDWGSCNLSLPHFISSVLHTIRTWNDFEISLFYVVSILVQSIYFIHLFSKVIAYLKIKKTFYCKGMLSVSFLITSISFRIGKWCLWAIGLGKQQFTFKSSLIKIFLNITKFNVGYGRLLFYSVYGSFSSLPPAVTQTHKQKKTTREHWAL